jgi:hypothetical protein
VTIYFLQCHRNSGPEGTYGVVTRGYNPGDQVVAILKAWLEGPPANG